MLRETIDVVVQRDYGEGGLSLMKEQLFNSASSLHALQYHLHPTPRSLPFDRLTN